MNHNLNIDFLSWDDCKTLINNKMDIGSHSINHFKSSLLTEDQLLIEMKNSKNTIEDKLEIECKHYASPFGDFVPNREFTSAEVDGGGGAEIYFFAVDWCPYSKKAKPVWDKIKRKFDGKEINNQVIRFIDVDGDKDSKALEKFEDKYLNGKKIDGYPSVYLVKGSQVIEYEAKPDENTMTEFINSVL